MWALYYFSLFASPLLLQKDSFSMMAIKLFILLLMVYYTLYILADNKSSYNVFIRIFSQWQPHLFAKWFSHWCENKDSLYYFNDIFMTFFKYYEQEMKLIGRLCLELRCGICTSRHICTSMDGQKEIDCCKSYRFPFNQEADNIK